MTLVVVALFGVHDRDTIVALGTLVGFVPAGITWLVTTVRKPGA